MAQHATAYIKQSNALHIPTDGVCILTILVLYLYVPVYRYVSSVDCGTGHDK